MSVYLFIYIFIYLIVIMDGYYFLSIHQHVCQYYADVKYGIISDKIVDIKSKYKFKNKLVSLT